MWVMSAVEDLADVHGNYRQYRNPGVKKALSIIFEISANHVTPIVMLPLKRLSLIYNRWPKSPIWRDV